MRGRGDSITLRVLRAEAKGLRDAAHSATTAERQLDSFRYTNPDANERMWSRRVGRRL